MGPVPLSLVWSLVCVPTRQTSTTKMSPCLKCPAQRHRDTRLQMVCVCLTCRASVQGFVWSEISYPEPGLQVSPLPSASTRPRGHLREEDVFIRTVLHSEPFYCLVRTSSVASYQVLPETRRETSHRFQTKVDLLDTSTVNVTPGMYVCKTAVRNDGSV